MRALIKAWTAKAVQVGIAAEILLLTLSVGVVIGFLIMALGMVALTSSPEAWNLAQAAARRAL